MTHIEALYRQHGAALMDYLRRNRPAGDSAEDLLQETFLQALRGADRLAEVASPRAWLFGIARNVARTAMRRRRSAALPEQVVAQATQTNSALEGMRESIDQLPIAQREPLQLRIAYGLTYEEIATVLDIPLGTVRSRLHHAVRRLRDEMVEDLSDQTGTT